MEIDEADVRIRLQRLWKGTLFVGVGGSYLLIVSLTFINHGWRAALLSVFFIVLAQSFRYIANDVDRIGWNIDRDQESSVGDSTRRYQKHMFSLLSGLAQIQNLALIAQAQALAGIAWAMGTLAVLGFIEVLHSRIRKINREVEFEQASYGFRDRGVLDRPESVSPADQAKRDRLEKKLDQLKVMAENREITQDAYEEIRDRYRIHLVMEDDRLLKQRGWPPASRKRDGLDS